MKPLGSLTPRELLKARGKADVESTVVNDAMIAAGRGYEKAWDTLAKAKEANADALTLRFAASSARWGEMGRDHSRRGTPDDLPWESQEDSRNPLGLGDQPYGDSL